MDKVPLRPLMGAFALAAGPALAAGGPLGIDHELNHDDRGYWSERDVRTVRNLSALAVVGGALWEGSESRLGRTLWKATDAMVLADLSAEAGKRVFRRARPLHGNGPNDWFGAADHHSFPSTEVAHITAVITPFIVEYGREHPAVWGLAALPVYVGVGRMKAQAHWQTDVLAGAALGAAIGYAMATRETSFSAMVLPHGVAIGLRRQF
jgi:undecaprenyl-diphosphatase